MVNGRGNFPKIHENRISDMEGHGWVRVGKTGSDGCSGTHAHEGDEKQDKKDTNTCAGHVFQCTVTAKKNRKLSRMLEVVRGDHWGAIMGKQGVCGDVVYIS